MVDLPASTWPHTTIDMCSFLLVSAVKSLMLV